MVGYFVDCLNKRRLLYIRKRPPRWIAVFDTTTHSVITSPPNNRRRRKRYALRFEVEYRVFGKGHSIIAGYTTTVNLSSDGILLEETAALVRGQLVELSILWQAGIRGQPKTTLEILGRVLRVDDGGTAVRILRYGLWGATVAAMP